MRNKMHTIWLTAMTLIALLLSSVTASASLILSPMPTKASMPVVMSDSADEQMKCGSIPQATNSDCQHNDGSSINDHQCCPAGCVISFPLASNTSTTYLQTTEFVDLPPDSMAYVNSLTRTLYRPPIF